MQIYLLIFRVCFKFNISGSGDISVYNFGDRPVRPIVKLGASAKKCNSVYERQIACVYVKRSDND